MDFLKIREKATSKGVIEICPDFLVKTKDLMRRGGEFYAFWDEESMQWSQDEARCIEVIDQELKKRADQFNTNTIYVKYLNTISTGSYYEWKKYLKSSIDNFKPLNPTLVYSNTEKKRELYSSHSLPYALAPGDHPAYSELMNVLYDPEELDKAEWLFGSIVAEKSKKLQKFLVLIGDAGTGKSTVINIVQKIFQGYCGTVKASVLGNPNSSFPLESLKDNPLVAFDNEAKLNNIKDNTIINSLVAHEPQVVNTKFAKKFTMAFDTMLVLGSNEEVKITDARSGLQRRLIDVRPTGKLVSFRRYNTLMKQIDFELGAIAYHWKEVYESNPEKYLKYRPTRSIRATNYIYNFLEENYLEYKEGVALKQVWADYIKYCDDAGITFKMNRMELKQELTAYFAEFIPDTKLADGSRVFSYFKSIKPEKFGYVSNIVDSGASESGEKSTDDGDWLDLKVQHSLLDDEFKDFPAQYAKLRNGQEIPIKPWDDVKTTLKDIDTTKFHYVRPDSIYVELDLDLKDESGKKNYDLNIKAASCFPKTYVETSKSDQGLHMVYKYTGDPSELDRIVDEDIEIKVHLGKAAMRRKLTRCNNVPIATISSGLPLKGGKKKVIDSFEFKDANHLRNSILKLLRMETVKYHAECVSLILKNLDEAYEQGFKYDVSDLAGVIYDFGQESRHQKDNCAKMVAKMHFKSKHYENGGESIESVVNRNFKMIDNILSNKRVKIFDIESYPNLFVFCYGYVDDPDNIVGLVNPDGETIKKIFNDSTSIIGGFNNRRYDNHICYARTLGYAVNGLYKRSKMIIDGERNASFGPAYDISDFDLWDIASNKQGLKKWEYQLAKEWDIDHPGEEDKNPYEHMEMSIPWDKDVPEEMWDDVVKYCKNDVRATIGVYEAIHADWKCREILAELSGLKMINTNRQHITKILLGDDDHPQHVYTNLATGEQFPDNIPGIYKPGEVINSFPGYEYVDGKNMYRDTDVGKGGYVYAKPGMYTNVALLDVGNMHGASILALNKFGVHTQNYKMIRDARMAIKHHDYETAAKLFDGKLKKYLGSDEEADQLQNALKLVLNSTYGIAAATFDNPLRDKRDVNNIIALRGALFMRTLQDEVTERGYTVAHIKTDSIKIPDADDKIIKFCIEFGEKYGYEFEHEATYSKMCLVNGSTYIARYDSQGIRNKGGKKANEWTATATQFQIPYVFKTLFSHKPLEFDDFCETKTVQEGALYLDFNEGLKEGETDLRFVGRVGRFCPIKPGCGGAELFRIKDGKYYAATGTKGYRWMESSVVKQLKLQDCIDESYYKEQVNQAVVDISKYGDFNWFTSDDQNPMPEDYSFDEVDGDPLAGLMNEPVESK